MYYFLITLIIGLLIYIIYFKKKVNKLSKDSYIELNKKLEESYKNRLWEISSLERKEEERLTQAKNLADVAIANAEVAKSNLRGIEKTLESKRESAQEIEAQLQNQLQIKKDNIDLTLQNYYNSNYTSYKSQLDSILSQLKSESSEELEEFLEKHREEIERANLELSSLKTEVEDYRQKREVINKEILRQREISENQDFYRVCLSDEAKADINYLVSILNHFNNKETIYKIIWTEYIQQPFKNMLKRTLGNKDPKNVIYMIKNEKSGEIYIGKTKAEITKRWTEHIKTSLNIGTISRTNIHKALFSNWDNFTFTILEEVPLDKNLGEREKFYIDFYKSDIYGYNIKSGG